MKISLHGDKNCTFKISGVNVLGPFEENDATLGAGCDPNTVFEDKILDVGLLFIGKKSMLVQREK